jgi:hypothetical protein
MRDDQPAGNDSEIEDLIRKVRGVLAVRVVRNDQGQIDELHAVGSPQRSAKQMVRDIESILYVRGGIRIDHRKISLVQIAEAGMPVGLVRVQLLEVARHDEQEPPAIAVALAVGTRRVEGVAHAHPDRDHSDDQIVAQATAQALDKLIGAIGHLHVENLQRQAFGALQVCLAHLSLTTDDGIETLLGISVVRHDEPSAVARAVLDAMNRRLQRLLGTSDGMARN